MPKKVKIEEQLRWQEHVKLAELHKAGYSDYCRQNRISKDSLYYWRSKFSIGRDEKRSSPSSFIPVQVTSTGNEHISSTLPDPEWLAEFVLQIARKIGDRGLK